MFHRKQAELLTASQRRELAAQANRLSAQVVVSAGPVGDAVAAHVIRAFGKGELLKVRINTSDRDEAQATADALAQHIGGEIVKRLGFVVVLFRPQAVESGEANQT